MLCGRWGERERVCVCVCVRVDFSGEEREREKERKREKEREREGEKHAPSAQSTRVSTRWLRACDAVLIALMKKTSTSRLRWLLRRWNCWPSCRTLMLPCDERSTPTICSTLCTVESMAAPCTNAVTSYRNENDLDSAGILQYHRSFKLVEAPPAPLDR